MLYFDVSREGRFQDTDEFGHYSHECRKRGKWVWYVELGDLPKKREPMHDMIIAMKRVAAADYSAKLSDRVWHGSVRVSQQGYSAGGFPGYGLERILLNEQHRFICVLRRGEHKQISNQRVSFRPANDAATATVRFIFRRFVEDEALPYQIAADLNRRGSTSALGGAWTSGKIIRILSNETYIGTRIYNKTWQQLGGKREGRAVSWAGIDPLQRPEGSRHLAPRATGGLNRSRQIVRTGALL